MGCAQSSPDDVHSEHGQRRGSHDDADDAAVAYELRQRKLRAQQQLEAFRRRRYLKAFAEDDAAELSRRTSPGGVLLPPPSPGDRQPLQPRDALSRSAAGSAHSPLPSARGPQSERPSLPGVPDSAGAPSDSASTVDRAGLRSHSRPPSVFDLLSSTSGDGDGDGEGAASDTPPGPMWHVPALVANETDSMPSPRSARSSSGAGACASTSRRRPGCPLATLVCKFNTQVESDTESRT